MSKIISFKPHEIIRFTDGRTDTVEIAAVTIDVCRVIGEEVTLRLSFTLIDGDIVIIDDIPPLIAGDTFNMTFGQKKDR